MKPNKEFHIPIFFQKQSSFEDADTRFMKVKIWLCHTGSNVNGSYFEKSVIEQAIPTLANTPILAFIEENSLGEMDFSDHRMVITKSENGYQYRYIGRAVGLIPETNNAHFEFRLCDDGIEREYLVVDGLVWQNKWDDAPDIFQRDFVKAQSMELDEQCFKGFVGEDGYFHFTEIKFYGACCLGIDYQPAMVNSTIELTFSKEPAFVEMQRKMEQYKKLFEKDAQSNVKGGKNQLTKEKIDEILAEHHVTLAQLGIKDTDELTEEQLLDAIEDFKKNKKDIKEEDEKPSPSAHEKFQRKIELLNSVIENAQKDSNESKNHFYVTDYDSAFIYGKKIVDGEMRTGRIAYTENKKTQEISLADDFEETVTYSVDEDFKNKKAFQSLQAEFATYKQTHVTEESEVCSLRAFQAERLAQDKESAALEIFALFEDLNGIAEFEALKAEHSNLNTEEIETKCYTIRGKHVTVRFTKKEPEVTTLPVLQTEKTENSIYGDVFARYGITKEDK